MTRSPHAASSPIMVSDAAPRGYAYVASIPEILGDRATPTLKLLGANRLVVREAMLASPTPVCIVLLAREVDSVRASGVSNSRTIGRGYRRPATTTSRWLFPGAKDDQK